MNEYSVDTLDDIGCFVVLEKTEYAEFDMSSMELVEIVNIGNEVYLHGVNILSDNFGEDIFLEVGVVIC